jgi:hypothetical protein
MSDDSQNLPPPFRSIILSFPSLSIKVSPPHSCLDDFHDQLISLFIGSSNYSASVVVVTVEHYHDAALHTAQLASNASSVDAFGLTVFHECKIVLNEFPGWLEVLSYLSLVLLLVCTIPLWMPIW